MKCVILAGGRGTRIAEETSVRPKPLIEVGGRPILWHIMKIYAAHGVTDFIVCAGYKGYLIKEYFVNYHLHASDVTVDLATNALTIHQTVAEPWRVTVVDTGEETLTGGRLRRVRRYVGEETFCFTYGDGVSDVDVSAVVAQHRRDGATATLTAVQPPGRYGAVDLRGTRVDRFREKPRGDDAWINGGYFVLEPAVFDLISGDETSFEAEPLQALAARGELGAYRHEGFWQPLDTLRDKLTLEDLWERGRAPWRTWS
ncbi:MAG: glucose-phosphate cytidylyltransferase [Candidatus Eremiobacteraeota bacterium]|nr:glucose-phosphate cytidylyltransferase [Candidatus Eremiobacteraeota bacterium]